MHKAMRAIIPLLILGILASCDYGSRSPTTTTTTTLSPVAPAFQPPTATEVFNLRTECARLGKKILNDNYVGPALTQSQISNYNQKKNRCYVEVTVQNADLKKIEEYLHTYLFDGQTAEMLAFSKMEKGEKVGYVFKKVVPTQKNDEAGFNAANEYITEMMKDD